MRQHRSQRGMTTAEYAVGTAAACGFAGLLYLCGPFFDDLLRAILGVIVREARLAWGFPR